MIGREPVRSAGLARFVLPFSHSPSSPMHITMRPSMQPWILMAQPICIDTHTFQHQHVWCLTACLDRCLVAEAQGLGPSGQVAFLYCLLLFLFFTTIECSNGGIFAHMHQILDGSPNWLGELGGGERGVVNTDNAGRVCKSGRSSLQWNTQPTD